MGLFVQSLLLPLVSCISCCILCCLFFYVIYVFWVSPLLVYRKLRKRGFAGPSPSFPLGNITEMDGMMKKVKSPSKITHDIHSTALPFFAKWRKLYGKTFIYWLGAEPFLYIGDPEFLKQLNSAVVGKDWGKPSVFRYDREPMFGNGLIMLEGDDWTHHKNIIAPAFTAHNLKEMITLMTETTNRMLDRWCKQINSGQTEVQADIDIINNAAEIIARTSFGITDEDGEKVFQQVQILQNLLFRSNRLVGVPHSKILSLKHTIKTKKAGKEIDRLLHSLITRRTKANDFQKDLLGLLLADNSQKKITEKKLSIRELVNECKTFFFAGFETTGLALTWTVLILGLHPKWQQILREEIMEVVGDNSLDYSLLEKLIKMEWVMYEVLRLYPSAPNLQRQANKDIIIGNVVIPRGTNIWVDLVGLHHDPELWGSAAHEFLPERFRNSINGGCTHRMGYLPFGFGGRMCVGKRLSVMEYKIVLTLILSRFSISVSANYCHFPHVLLSLRPSHGVPLIVQPL